MKCRTSSETGRARMRQYSVGMPCVAELVAGLDDRPVGAAVGDQADLGAGVALDDRARAGLPRAVSSLRARRSRFFFQSSGRSL